MSEVITIDGPTSAGKNSVGILLSQKLGFQFIDSGSIFRVGTIMVLRAGVPLDDEDKLAEVFNNLDLKFETKDGEVKVFNSGEDLTEKLHDVKVSQAVSILAKFKKVREVVREIQKKVVTHHNIIMTGRDIGSVIFPDAKHKFFLTADPKIRAQRRFEQLKQKTPKISLKDVFRQMIERDEQDTKRKESPLVIPKGAVVIDNSQTTVEETVNKMLEYYRQNK